MADGAVRKKIEDNPFVVILGVLVAVLGGLYVVKKIYVDPCEARLGALEQKLTWVDSVAPSLSNVAGQIATLEADQKSRKEALTNLRDALEKDIESERKSRQVETDGLREDVAKHRKWIDGALDFNHALVTGSYVFPRLRCQEILVLDQVKGDEKLRTRIGTDEKGASGIVIYDRKGVGRGQFLTYSADSIDAVELMLMAPESGHRRLQLSARGDGTTKLSMCNQSDREVFDVSVLQNNEHRALQASGPYTIRWGRISGADLPARHGMFIYDERSKRAYVIGDQESGRFEAKMIENFPIDQFRAIPTPLNSPGIGPK